MSGAVEGSMRQWIDPAMGRRRAGRMPPPIDRWEGGPYPGFSIAPLRRVEGPMTAGEQTARVDQGQARTGDAWKSHQNNGHGAVRTRIRLQTRSGSRMRTRGGTGTGISTAMRWRCRRTRWNLTWH